MRANLFIERKFFGLQASLMSNIDHPMNLEEYRSKYSSTDGAPGWDAIDERLSMVYASQKPHHWAATPHYALGGEDPLEGISIYQSNASGFTHLHFVTYGFSALYYDEEQLGKEFSKFGFELTLRLRPYEGDAEFPSWVWSLLQNLARYVFKSGNWFEEFQYLDARGPIRLNTETEIVAFVFLLDPELGRTDTAHGRVDFIQAYGITEKEFERIKSGSISIPDLLAEASMANPLLITDLNRRSG